MARRNALQGIANSFNDHFVSRNNDFGGYWAIGQLRQVAMEKGLSSLVFTFPACESLATSSVTVGIEQHCSKLLEKMMVKQQVPVSWVKSTRITLDFNIDVEGTVFHHCSRYGEPYQSVCQIIGEHDRVYSSVIHGRCLPHSIEREFRSTRNTHQWHA